jgi:predicted amidophosphoribosyltransferase
MWFERRCATCDRAGDELCATCAARLVPVGEVAAPPGLERCWCLFDYDGIGRDVVLALKFHNRRGLGAVLGAGMAALVAGQVDPAAVTWAPTSAARKAERGYDQARLLAAGVAAGLAVSRRRLLRRRRGSPQTGGDLVARHHRPHFVAMRHVPALVEGPVVLVDDVLTSGSTLSAAATALRAAGAREVVALTAARTSRHAGR